MSDDKTWSMEDMEMLWPEGNSLESAKPDAPAIEFARAVKKPAYHNSKVKAALLLLGGTCFAVLGTLLFTLTSGKTPEKVVATAPETTQPVVVSNDGWETAAKQSASDAGTAINIPETQKPNTEQTPATPTKPVTPTVAVVPSVVKASPVIQTPSQPIAAVPAVKPKPIELIKPVVQQQVAAKVIPAAAVPAVKSKPTELIKPVVQQQVAAKAIPAAAVPAVKSKPTELIKPVVQQQVAAKAIPAAAVLAVKPKPTELIKPVVQQQVAANLTPVAAVLAVKPKPTELIKPVVQQQVAANLTPVAAPISWEQASAAGVYGGDAVMPQPVNGFGVKDGTKQQQSQRQQSTYEGALSPTLLLAAGTNVKGHTLAPYTVGISKDRSDSMPLSIALDEPIELDKGYRLPVGTTINFIASVRDNGSVVAVSKNADIGGVEIQLPEGAISLASDNNGLLMAREISTGDGDLARADVNSSIWGGVAGAGRAILQSGSQTTTNTGLLGTTTIQTNNGSPNIIGGLLDGAFTPLATNGQKRAQQAADRVEKRSKLNTIDVNTKVKLFINIPVQVQIPVSGQQVGQASEEEELPPPRLITSNSVPSSTANELPQQVSATQMPAVLLLAPAQPVVTPLPLSPPKTRISRPW